MKNHYFKTKLIKMGHWATPPLDTGTWHRLPNSLAFKKLFGIPKGLLGIYTADTGHDHIYVPENWLKLLGRTIDKINSKNFKSLEKKIKTIYPLLIRAKKAVVKVYRDPQKLSNKQIATAFTNIRHWVHRLTVFDQFGWLAEEYWTPLMRNILENKLRLPYSSEQYNKILFALAKPEQISTTLLEKKTVLEQAIKIRTKKSTVETSAKRLAKMFGWLPVFTYGEPWTDEHYREELVELNKTPLEEIKKQQQVLQNYSAIRNNEIKNLVKKYNLSKKDLQIFIDFGLALDGRNEAEYFVSFAGFYLMPLYKEITKRLYISPAQLRILTDDELCEILRGEKSAEQFPYFNAKFRGAGFNKNMTKIFDYTPAEAEKLYNYVESYVKPIQGGDETKGICASPGIVRGRVCVVPSPSGNNKVKNGDVMITHATTTDYLPAMKRAAAIITEVGGLTCHAAVVSREFGIPCIVALTNAMKNFKDGEMVEVNANNGTVKRI